MTFKIGDRVEKFTGAYTTFGEVRAVYTTKRGDVRYVVEVEPQGFQMIWGGKELRGVSGLTFWIGLFDPRTYINAGR
jgi:hypothetical protein